jgi:S13-like H2TH domain
VTGMQSREALALANEYKSKRYQLGEEVKAGEVKLSEVLHEPTLPIWLEGETCSRLLRRIPRLGTQRVSALLAELRIGQMRRVGGLTYRQRRELSEALAHEENRWNASGRRAIQHGRGLNGNGNVSAGRRSAAAGRVA